MLNHYHQCPTCGHIWSCACESKSGAIQVKDDRCEYGFSTGNRATKGRYQGKKMYKFGRDERGAKLIWPEKPTG